MKPHILVFDENPVHRELHGDLLHHAGYQVSEVPTPKDLREYLRNRTMPDLILMGLYWGGYTVGVALYHEILKEHPGARVLVATTAPANVLAQLGDIEYLCKPFGAEELRGAVKDALAVGSP